MHNISNRKLVPVWASGELSAHLWGVGWRVARGNESELNAMKISCIGGRCKIKFYSTKNLPQHVGQAGWKVFGCLPRFEDGYIHGGATVDRDIQI